MEQDKIAKRASTETKPSQRISFIHLLWAVAGAGLAWLAIQRYFAVERWQKLPPDSPDYIPLPQEPTTKSPES